MRVVLRKAHVSGYQRRGSKGDTVDVHDYETKTPPAQQRWSQAHVRGMLRAYADQGHARLMRMFSPRKPGQLQPPGGREPAQDGVPPRQPLGASRKPGGFAHKPPASSQSTANPVGPPPMPQTIQVAVQRVIEHGEVGLMRDYNRLPPMEREAVEQWLHGSDHPIAHKTHLTQAERFFAVVREIAGKAKKPAPHEGTRILEGGRKKGEPEPKDETLDLDQAPDGAEFTIPEGRKDLIGTWQKVTLGGEHYWKRKGANKYIRSQVFRQHIASAKKQVAEWQPKKKGKADRSVLTLATQKAPVAAKPEALQSFDVPDQQKGNTETVYTDRGDEVKVQYQIVEADQPIASHARDFRENPAFPKELQPRDRTRAASEAQIAAIVNQFQPALLAANPKASEGAPMVGPDGVVEIGNGRTLALRRIYEYHPEVAEKYKAFLAAHATDYGLNPQIVLSIANPMLIRVRQTQVDRQQFVRQTNKPAQATYSAAEQAKNDAALLTPELLSTYNPEADVTETSNRSFVRGFVQGLDATELGDFATAAGAIGQTGATRLRNALLHRAYENSDLVEKITEATDANTKTLSNALVATAPRIASMRAGIEKGELHDVDLSKDIAAASLKFGALKAQKLSVDDYLRQQEMGEPELSPLARELLPVFDRYARSGNKLRQFLTHYTNVVEAAGNPHQGDLLATSKPTKAEALAAALARAEAETEERDGPALFKSAASDRRRTLAQTQSVGTATAEETAGAQTGEVNTSPSQKIGDLLGSLAQKQVTDTDSDITDRAQRQTIRRPTRALRETGRDIGRKVLVLLKSAVAKMQRWRGIPVHIENPDGSTRQWHDPHNDTDGETKMERVAYGEFPGVPGDDGDFLDCFLGKETDASKVFIITIAKPPDYTEPDEDKVMLGFRTQNDAVATFLLHYSDPRFIYSIREMPFEQFEQEIATKRSLKSHAWAESEALQKSPVRSYTKKTGVFVSGYTRRDHILHAGANVKELHRHKEQVMAAGYPPEMVRGFVDQYYRPERYQALRGKDNVYLVMPSTSGKNSIPRELAERLRKDHGGTVVQDFAVPLAHAEAKHKTGFSAKMADPAAYKMIADVSHHAGRNVVIVDDVFNTGESQAAVRRVLGEQQIEVAHTAVLGASDTRLANQRDLDRLAEKIAGGTKIAYGEVRPHVERFFASTAKQFTNYAEREVSGPDQARVTRNARRLYDTIHHRRDLPPDGEGTGAVRKSVRAGAEPAATRIRSGSLSSIPVLAERTSGSEASGVVWRRRIGFVRSSFSNQGGIPCVPAPERSTRRSYPGTDPPGSLRRQEPSACSNRRWQRGYATSVRTFPTRTIPASIDVLVLALRKAFTHVTEHWRQHDGTQALVHAYERQYQPGLFGAQPAVPLQKHPVVRAQTKPQPTEEQRGVFVQRKEQRAGVTPEEQSTEWVALKEYGRVLAAIKQGQGHASLRDAVVDYGRLAHVHPHQIMDDLVRVGAKEEDAAGAVRAVHPAWRPPEEKMSVPHPQKVTLTGSVEHDARLQQYRKMQQTKAPMTAAQEQALALYEAQAAADPQRWKIDEGVGWRVDRQINRRFRIQQIDAEKKLALVRPVADTGLTVTGGGMEGIGRYWVHVASLVRDKKYDAPRTPQPSEHASPPPQTHAEPQAETLPVATVSSAHHQLAEQVVAGKATLTPQQRGQFRLALGLETDLGSGIVVRIASDSRLAGAIIQRAGVSLLKPHLKKSLLVLRRAA